MDARPVVGVHKLCPTRFAASRSHCTGPRLPIFPSVSLRTTDFGADNEGVTLWEIMIRQPGFVTPRLMD